LLSLEKEKRGSGEVNMAAVRALVVDDESELRRLYQEVLKSCNYEVDVSERGDTGLNLLKERSYRLLISDYMMPGMDGLELISQAKRFQPDINAVLITGYATTERVVSAMRAGASWVLEKPVELEKIEELARQLTRPQDGINSSHLLGEDFVSAFHGRMAELAELVKKVAATDCTVLISGESGTGKELVARAIHRLSRRKDGPFVPVNCGAIPETLLESELFGHTKGAFSGAIRDRPGRFALADGGSIFLDEIGEMSQVFQVKLLRVLQERCFEPVGGTRQVYSDFRVIAATHRDLATMVEEDAFREDLFYRLNVVEISLPPLRERAEDLPLLVRHFVDKFNKRHGLRVELEKSLLEYLKNYPWPGNVRELENVVERACILRSEGSLRLEDLPPKLMGGNNYHRSSRPLALELPPEGINLYQSLEEMENNFIRQALERCGGNRAQAAKMLGMNRTTLVEKLKKKGLL
jgi:DNA-binding NtrC family response regulator